MYTDLMSATGFEPTLHEGNVAEALEDEFEILLNNLANRQSDRIESERPTTVFVKKICSLIESEAVSVVHLRVKEQFVPHNFIGCEDDEYLYLNRETAHRAVRKLCDEQGESFSVSCAALVKQLAEEGLIKTLQSGNTVSLRFAGKNRRYIALRKKAIEFILNEE